MEKVEYLKIEEVENSGLFRYRNLLDDSAFSIGDEPVRFFRDMILSSLGGTESSYSIVKTEVRRMVIDEVEQHFKTEEAIMPLDGDAVLFAGEAGEAVRIFKSFLRCLLQKRWRCVRGVPIH